MALTPQQQAQIAELERQLNSLRLRVTRYERELSPNNIVDRVAKHRRLHDRTNTLVSRKPQKSRYLAGYVKHDPQYDAEVSYSDDGQTFSEPFVDPTARTVYAMRLDLTFHQAEPLVVVGTTVEWILDAGWGFDDDDDAETDHECVSNPLVIIRKVASPGTIPLRVRHRVVVRHRYL